MQPVNEITSNQSKLSPLPDLWGQLPPFLQKKVRRGEALNQEVPLLQLIGTQGSGCRRLAFDFLKPVRRALWVAPEWKIHAPLLWKIAEAQGIDLYGLELQDRSRLRALLQEVILSQTFDALILEAFSLQAGEGFFLLNLLRPFRSSMKALVIDEKPHAFCAKRIHLSLSHQSFRYSWSKGGDPTPRFVPFSYFQSLSQIEMSE